MNKCKNCKECSIEKGVCVAGMWDRSDPDETWIHSDSDFNDFINKDRFCSELRLVNNE